MTAPTPAQRATPARISWEQFCDRFGPTQNPLYPGAPLDGCMYAINAREMAVVAKADPACVWTLVDADGDLYLIDRFHFVNRLGYVICTRPLPEGATFEVAI